MWARGCTSPAPRAGYQECRDYPIQGLRVVASAARRPERTVRGIWVRLGGHLPYPACRRAAPEFRAGACRRLLADGATDADIARRGEEADRGLYQLVSGWPGGCPLTDTVDDVG